MLRQSKVGGALAVFALLASAGVQAIGQDRAARREVERADAALQIPSDGQLLEVTASYPREARVNSSFQYEIIVRNTSENIALHDIKLQQENTEGFEIESAEIVKDRKSPRQGTRNEKARNDNNKKGQNDKAQNDKAQNANNKKGQNQKDQSQKDQQAQQTAQGGWTIPELMPQETCRIRVHATSSSEGRGELCIAVKSYTPVLCLGTEFIKPDLELVKEAPETASDCQTFQYTYYIRNTGSAVAREFTVTDELPQGLSTQDGKSKIEFTVDELDPGQARKFMVAVSAEKAGEYSSRAVLKTDGGEEIRSQKPTTAVQTVDLAVSVEGPKVEYLNRPLSYTITVENRGEAEAPGTVLNVVVPDSLSLMRDQEFGDNYTEREVEDPEALLVLVPVAVEDSQANGRERPNREDRPQAANRQRDERRQQREQRNAARQKQSDRQAGTSQSQDGRVLEFSLDTLEPGESQEVTIYARAQKPGKHQLVARAGYVCDHDRASMTTESPWLTRVIALPAVQVYVIDAADPVRVGEEAVYRLVVQNEGEAADMNVNVEAELPEGLKFKRAEGPTDVKTDGNKLTMGKIDSLEPGEKAVWQIYTTAEKSGQVVMHATLRSDGLSQPAETEEPTRLYGEGESEVSADAQDGASANGKQDDAKSGDQKSKDKQKNSKDDKDDKDDK